MNILSEPTPRHVHNYMVIALEKGCRERKKLEDIIDTAHRIHHIADNALLRLGQLDREKPSRLDILLGRTSESIGIDFDALDQARKDVEKLAQQIGEDGTFEMNASRDNTVAGLRLFIAGAIEHVEPLRKALGLRK